MRETEGTEVEEDGGESDNSSDAPGDAALSSGAEAETTGEAVDGGTAVGKVIVRADQSTNGLKAVSQLRPKTAVDGESSLVT